MTHHLNPADLRTHPGRAAAINTPKAIHCDQGSAVRLIAIPCSLFHIPRLQVPQSLSPSAPPLSDSNHGEHNFPHFRCVIE